MNCEYDILCGTLETSPGRQASYHHPRTYTEWRAGWDTAHLTKSRIKNVSYLAAYYKYGEVPKFLKDGEEPEALEDHQKPSQKSPGKPDEGPWAWVKWRRDASTGVVVGGLPQKGYGLAGMAGANFADRNGIVPGTPLRAPSCAGSVRAASVRSQPSAPPPAAPSGPTGDRTSSAASSQRLKKVPKGTPRKNPRALSVAEYSDKEVPGSVVNAIMSPPRSARAQNLDPVRPVQSSTDTTRELLQSVLVAVPEAVQEAVPEARGEPKSTGLPKLPDTKKSPAATQESATPRTFRQSGLWRGAWRSCKLR